MDRRPVMALISRSIGVVLNFALSSLTVADFVIYQILAFLSPGFDIVEDRPLYIQDIDGKEPSRAASPSPCSSRHRVKKRIKLLLDVDIDGSEEANIMTATEFTPPPPKPSFFLIRWTVSWLQAVRQIMLQVRNRIERSQPIDGNSSSEGEASTEATSSGTPSHEARSSERKTKQARKRLTETDSNTSGIPLKLKTKGLFEVANPGEPSTLTFEMPNTEDLLRLKSGKAAENRSHPEKRKLSTSSVESLTPTNASVASDDAENSDATPTEASGGLPLKRSEHRSNLAAFMRDNDENYESSEDPNFSPNEDELNASSSTNETFDEEEKILETSKSQKKNGRNGNGNGSDEDVILEEVEEEEEEETSPPKIRIVNFLDPTRPDRMPEPEPCPQPEPIPEPDSDDDEEEPEHEERVTPAAAAFDDPSAQGAFGHDPPSTSQPPDANLSKTSSPSSSTNGKKDDPQCQSPSSDSSYDDQLLFFESSSNMTPPRQRTTSEDQDSASQVSSPFSYYSSRSPNSSSSSSSSGSSTFTFTEPSPPMQEQD